jgi:hypothetical protein
MDEFLLAAQALALLKLALSLIVIGFFAIGAERIFGLDPKSDIDALQQAASRGNAFPLALFYVGVLYLLSVVSAVFSDPYDAAIEDAVHRYWADLPGRRSSIRSLTCAPMSALPRAPAVSRNSCRSRGERRRHGYRSVLRFRDLTPNSPLVPALIIRRACERRGHPQNVRRSTATT